MNKVAKATIGLILITVLSKVLGFAREVVLGAMYGATEYSDIYIISMNIPGVLFSLLGTAISTTFIPLYHENNSCGGNEEGIKYTNNIFNITIIIAVVISIIAIIFTKPLVKLFALGYAGEKLDMTIRFTKIMMCSSLAIVTNNIMTAYLQAKEQFIIPGLIGFPLSIVTIISIIFSANMSIYLLPIGTVVAMFSQSAFLYYFARKYGYRYKTNCNIKDKYVNKMILLVAPVFIGVAVNQVNVMVDRTLASTLVEGSVAALNYANRLTGFVFGLFITSIGAVIYPMLSKLSCDNNIEEFNDCVIKSINSVILLVTPVSVGAMVLSKPIVKLLFERGAFDETATRMTSIALVFYSIGMVGFGLRDILSKVFYSLQDTKTPMVNGAISMGLNIIINILIIRFMGYAGLALATSISTLICTALLFINLKKKVKLLGYNKIFRTTIKSIVSAIIMGVITYYLYYIIASVLSGGFIKEFTALFISIFIGMIIYALLVLILKVEEVNILVKYINLKLNKASNIKNKLQDNI